MMSATKPSVPTSDDNIEQLRALVASGAITGESLEALKAVVAEYDARQGNEPLEFGASGRLVIPLARNQSASPSPTELYQVLRLERLTPVPLSVRLAKLLDGCDTSDKFTIVQSGNNEKFAGRHYGGVNWGFSDKSAMSNVQLVRRAAEEAQADADLRAMLRRPEISDAIAKLQAAGLGDTAADVVGECVINALAELTPM